MTAAAQARKREDVEIDVARPRLISWSAVFAGLVVVFGGTWLMYLLGLAIGVSIVDATDMAAWGDGLGIGAVVWMIVTALVVYFLGAMLTARLSGKSNDTVGILHGITLWGAGMTLMVVLTYLGVSRVMNTGVAAVSTAANATASTISTVSSGAVNAADSIGSGLSSLADTQLATNLQARLKRKAAEVVANSDPQGGANVNAEEVRRAIDNIDNAAMQNVATHLIMGEDEQARQVIVQNTSLSRQQVNEIVSGVSHEMKDAIDGAGRDASLAGEIAGEFRTTAARYIASMDQPGGADVTQAEVRAALRDLDFNTVQAASMRLIQGDEEGAKDLLAANTALTEREVEAIVSGVSDEVSETVDEYQAKFDETVETASDYAQGVIWTAFGTAALALAAAIFGGWLGTVEYKFIAVNTPRAVPA